MTEPSAVAPLAAIRLVHASASKLAATAAAITIIGVKCLFIRLVAKDFSCCHTQRCKDSDYFGKKVRRHDWRVI